MFVRPQSGKYSKIRIYSGPGLRLVKMSRSMSETFCG